MSKFSGICTVQNIIAISENIFTLLLDCPAIANNCKPGQFIQVKLPNNQAALWPRPFSIHSASNGVVAISIKKIGKITNVLSNLAAEDKLYVTGPLGNHFVDPPKGKDLYFIAGGVGLPPLHYFCRQLINSGYPRDKLHFYSGAKNRLEIFAHNELLSLGIDYIVATDDGSFGIKGFITEPLSVELKRKRIADPNFSPVVYGCGPTLMLKKVAEICLDIPCYVSLEQLMPCGWGVCNGCAVKLKYDNAIETEDKRNFRLARVCKEGPVFDAAEVLWE